LPTIKVQNRFSKLLFRDFREQPTNPFMSLHSMVSGVPINTDSLKVGRRHSLTNVKLTTQKWKSRSKTSRLIQT